MQEVDRFVSVAASAGVLHRTVYVLLKNCEGSFLLQKRHPSKSVCSSRVDLTCAEHLATSEAYESAASRGLREELGIEIAPESFDQLLPPRKRMLRIDTSTSPSKRLYDFEFVPVLQATYDGAAVPDEEEVSEIMWIKPEHLREQLQQHGSRWLSPWFANILYELGYVSKQEAELPNEQQVIL